MKRLAILLCVTLLIAGCGGGGSSTTPGNSTPASVAGNYSGSSRDSQAGNGIVSAAITQNGSIVSGYWGSAYSNGVNGGTLSGTVTGNTVSGTLTSQVAGGCSGTFSGTVSGSTFSGSYTGTSAGCTNDTGSFAASSVSVPSVGNYTGTVNDALAGSGTLSFNLTQNLVWLVGSWSDTFANPANNNSGTAYGVVTGPSSLEILAVSNVAGACPFVATGTFSGTTLSGNYTAIDCSVTDNGTFSVSQH